MVLVLVGNKSDLESYRAVPAEEGEEFAKRNGMLFMETSAKKATKIGDIFVESARMVFEKINAQVIDPKNDMYGIKPGNMYNVEESGLMRMAMNKDKKKGCCE